MGNACHADADDEEDLVPHESKDPDRDGLPGDGMVIPARVPPTHDDDGKHTNPTEEVAEADDDGNRQLAYGIFRKDEVAGPKQQEKREQQV